MGFEHLHDSWVWFLEVFSPCFLGGGFKYFIFSPRKLGKIPILTHIFQGGWNHPTSFVLGRRLSWCFGRWWLETHEMKLLPVNKWQPGHQELVARWGQHNPWRIHGMHGIFTDQQMVDLYGKCWWIYHTFVCCKDFLHLPTCCSFPFFGVEGGALGFRWKSTICRFLWVVVFRANKAVWCRILKQTVQWNMDHISAVLVGLEAREILNIANVACRDLKNLMFFEISKRWTPPECSERSVFRSTSPFGTPLHHWNGMTCFPTHFGANPNPEFYPGLVFPGWN